MASDLLLVWLSMADDICTFVKSDWKSLDLGSKDSREMDENATREVDDG